MSHAEVAALRAELASIRDQNAKLVQDREQDALKISALQAALETSASPRLSPPPPVAGNLQRMVSANVPTEFGAFEVILFRKEDADAKLDRDGELALVYGGVERVHQDGKTTGQGALVRVHSSCFTSDVLRAGSAGPLCHRLCQEPWIWAAQATTEARSWEGGPLPEPD